MSSDSSDYSDSGDEQPKVQKSDSSGSGSSSDSDSDGEDARPSREATAKKQPIIESGGDSDGSLSDSEGSGDEGPSKKKKKAEEKTKKVTKKRRRNSSGDEDRPNRELFETEDEYERWQQMNEKDREQEIFNRMEQVEMKKTREQIEERLKAKMGGDGEKERDKRDTKRREEKKKRKVESDSEDEESREKEKKKREKTPDSDMDAEFHRPSDMDKKKKHKNAMADLLARRKDKEKKDAKKASLSIHDVFGKEESNSGSSSSESSSDSSRSSSSSRESSPTRKHSDDEKTKAGRKPVDCKEDLGRARLSRFKLAKLVHAPFFSDVATGAYVRIQTGPIPGSKSRYRIARIMGVVETAKVYNLVIGNDTKVPPTRTNKGLRLKCGKHDRVYRLEFVSNTEFPDDEFTEWKTITMQEDTLPTMDHVAKKQREIAKAMNHTFTNKEIDTMMKEKARFNKTPRNFAMTKGELMKQKEWAEQTGNTERVRQLQREIEELDSKADRLDKARSADISAITWINQRNRNKMKEQFLGENLQFDMINRDDPFTRKKDRMKIVGSGRGRREAAAGAAADAAATQDPTVASSSTGTALATPKGGKPEAKSTAGGMHLSKSANDLFDLHSGLGKIDIDIDLGSLSRGSDVRHDVDMPTVSSSSNPQNDSRRMVSLDDYRKRKAAAQSSK